MNKLGYLHVSHLVHLVNRDLEALFHNRRGVRQGMCYLFFVYFCCGCSPVLFLDQLIMSSRWTTGTIVG